MTVFSVDLCQGWQRIGQLQGEAFDFQAVERFREMGEWSVTFPDGAPSWSSRLVPEGDPDAVMTRYGPRDVDTVRLVEDGTIRYGGYVEEAASGVGGIERTVDASGVRWKLNGPDLWDVLRRRLAFPVPTTSTPSSWTSSHDVNTGVASTVLATYLTDNAGATANVGRQINGFSVYDAVVGDSGTWSGRLQPLYELARRIIDDAELTIRWTVDSAGAVTAAIERQRDLSAHTVLSDQGDLSSLRVRSVPARATWVLAGGDGAGTGRTFRVADSGATGAARRERFVDVSSLNQTAEVQATANANMRLDARTWVVNAEATDAAATAFGFGRDLLVGDIISVQVDGERVTVPITAISWQINAGRQVARPTLGEASPDALRGLIRDVANLAARFDNQIA